MVYPEININILQQIKSNMLNEWNAVSSRFSDCCKLVGAPEPQTFGAAPLGDLQSGTENQDLDDRTYDPAIPLKVETASDYYSNLFFPSENPFTVITEKLEKEQLQELNKYISDSLNRPESGFVKAKGNFYYDFVLLGNSGYQVFDTGDYLRPFKIKFLGVDTTAYDSDNDIALSGFEWTANQIRQELVDKDNKAENLPADVIAAINDYDITKRFKLYQIILPNPNYEKGLKGKNGFEYAGYWFFENTDKIYRTDYYKESPIDFCHYKLIRGESYGRSAINMYIGGFRTLDGILFLTLDTIGRMARPAVGYFDVGSTGTLDLDFTAGNAVGFNQALAGKASPVFNLQQIGNIEPLITFLHPYIEKNLDGALKLDAMRGRLSENVQARTATEVLDNRNIANKILYGIVKLHASELIGFQRRIANICIRQYAIKNDISEEEVADIIDDYQIQNNGLVAEIMQQDLISQFNNDVNVLSASLQLDPSMQFAVDIYDATSKALRFVDLKPKAEWKKAVAERNAIALDVEKSKIKEGNVNGDQ